MAMAAHTGCNTVYGSTPPNNPHPYPWMNSLFQDGITVGWLLGESFIVDHGRRSVIPERLLDALMTAREDVINPREYYEYVHFSDAVMTDQEILEMPKVWVVGGDGGMGDIGYQNMSKVILQNRPNVKAVMLDTQVYSNTGGQNSDSTPMLGGNDMNMFGTATQGKNVEKKTVAETFLAGHGSPFVAQISIANAPKLYRSILDGIEYRGTAFLQCFTTCQPEHGVADDMALTQAQRVRDSRGAPEFVFNPRLGETYPEALDVKGNPSIDMDWYETKFKSTNEPYRYTVAHWCATEARFRNHLKKIKMEDAAKLISLENMLVRITQQDVVYRRYLVKDHRSFVPDFGVYIKVQGANGKVEFRALSRQLVLFCVERRKAWRMLQSKAGIENREYKAQRAILADVDAGKITKEQLFAGAEELMKARLGKPAAHAPRHRRTAPLPPSLREEKRRRRRELIAEQGKSRSRPYRSAPTGAIIRAGMRSIYFALIVVVVAAASLFAQDVYRQDSGGSAGQEPLEGNVDAITAGMGAYRVRCADCHGMDARGIRGPDITQVWARGRTDAALFRTIRNGGAEHRDAVASRASDIRHGYLAHPRLPQDHRAFDWRHARIRQRHRRRARLRHQLRRLPPHRRPRRKSRSRPLRIGAARARAAMARQIRGTMGSFRTGYEPVTLTTPERTGDSRRQEERRFVFGAGHGYSRAYSGLSARRHAHGEQ